MKKSLLILFLLPAALLAQKADVTVSKSLHRIAFGSCSVQSMRDNQLWSEINSTNPELWIWLGDNIYGDTEDMTVMKEKYDLQKSHPGYQRLLQKTSVIGIWDDHDYGVNDGGKEYPAKDGSKKALFDFLDVDKNNPAQKRKGAYQSYTYKSNEGTVKVILLDTRYFRDSLKWNNPGTREKESLVNPDGDILGEEQWVWLESQLSEPNINFFMIASGIQILPYQHRWEKWSNFPKAKERLLKTISTVDVPIVLLTGDRHLSEVSKVDIEGYKYPLYEFTSSSLTSPSGIDEDEEKNEFIVKDKIYQTNFAALTIMWIADFPTLSLKYVGKDGKELMRHKIEY